MQKTYYSPWLLFLGSLPVKRTDHRMIVAQELLRGLAGTYKLTALKYKAGADSPELDYMPFREVCENDDLIVLEANGTYRYNDLGQVCSTDGSGIGTWSVAGNVIISDGIVSGTIQNFDCHFLTVYSDDFIIPGDRITLTIEKQ